MQDMTDLTDRTALRLHRQRAAIDPADFLRVAVADEVHERLTEVNRSFTTPLVITPHSALWQDAFPDVTICDEADVLDVPQAHFDLVIHDLHLHWANDLVGQLVQSRRALVPDGLFIGTLFGGQTLHELRTSTLAPMTDGSTPPSRS